MSCLKINQATYPYEQLKVEIPKLDLIPWLSQQQIYPKVYWKDRDTAIEYAALGNILSFSSLPVFDHDLTNQEVRFYGGMHFAPIKKNTYWKHFPSCAFWLPSFELKQTRDSAYLILHFYNEKPSDSKLSNLTFSRFQAKNQSPIELLRKENGVSLASWKKQISHVLKLIKEEKLEKVVLARKIKLLFSHPPCVWDMMEKLKSKAVGATLFVFQMNLNHVFFGVSPEKLFYRKDRLVWIDALAGTRKRETSKIDDFKSEDQLRNHLKEKFEFICVKDFIQKTAHSLSETFAWKTEDAVRKTAYVQHLYNQAVLKLKKHISDRELMAAFHPTPAVGGFPREKALNVISELESFQRGWYAAPVGWISPSETNFIVGIRSGLLQYGALHLFGGAGIVNNSIAENEWKEIDHKMRILLYGCGLTQ